MQTTSNPRILQPVTERFREDGAPHVRLDAEHGLKNAAIIYQAIRTLPGKALLRGDFDRTGKPLVFFPERPKKDIGKLAALSPIKARNIEADRKDMARFLGSIVDAVNELDAPDQKSLEAADTLNKQIGRILEGKRDFHVAPLRESLRTLACTYKRIERQKIISHYKNLYRHHSSIRDRRLRQFCQTGRDRFTQLSDALKPAGSSRYDVSVLMAVHEMKHFLKAYLRAKSTQSQSFSDYLRFAGITDGVHLFAKRWMAISNPVHTPQRMQFDTESWSKELDSVCLSILETHRRRARVDQTLVDREAQASRLVYLRPAHAELSALPTMPPLPPVPSQPPQAERQTVMLRAVPKTAVAPTISVYEAAHTSPDVEPEREEALVRSGQVSQRGLASRRETSVDEGRSASVAGTSLFPSDSQLINDIRIMLEGPRNVRYQPITLPPDTGADDTGTEEQLHARTLYRLPKQEVRTSSDLHYASLTEQDPESSRTDVPSVSSTEVDPSIHSTSVELPAPPEAEPFRLHLELSDDGEPDEDASH